MAANEDRTKIVDAVRRLLDRDAAAGKLQPVATYERLFAGFEDLVQAEHAARAAAPAAAPAEEPVTAISDAPPQARAPGSGTGRGARDDRRRSVGPYTLLREVGRGGMGVVYEAEDTRLARRVALKVLPAHVLASDSLRMRFEREASIAARLDHPNVCTVYEAGESDGTPWMAMRFVDGRPLSDLVAESREEAKRATRTSGMVRIPRPAASPGATPVPTAEPAAGSSRASRFELDRVLEIFEKTARALHAAHEKGLIHRDVKPHNVMVAVDGEPVVLDFGLAREEEGESHHLTMTGTLMGTPAYMSPEQLVAQRIRLDRRTDVYSLGVSLFECLTLRLPYEAPTTEKLYQKILSAEPEDMRRLNPALPGDLRVVVQTAMDRDRDRRYQTALAFAEDLRRVRSLEPIAARPAGAVLRMRRWVQRNRVATALLVALTFGTVMAVRAFTANRDLVESMDEVVRLRDKSLAAEAEARDALVRVTEEQRRTKEVADVARSAALVAAAGQAADDADLRLLLLDAAFEASPTADAESRLIEVLGNSPASLRLGDDGPGRRVAWTAEGDRVLCCEGGNLVLREPDGAEVRRRPVAHLARGEILISPRRDFALVWPGTTRQGLGGDLSLVRTDLTAAPRRVAPAGERGYTAAAWRPTGECAVLAGPRGTAVLRADGTLTPVADEPALSATFDAPGARCAVLLTSGDIEIRAADGGLLHRLPGEAPSWSFLWVRLAGDLVAQRHGGGEPSFSVRRVDGTVVHRSRDRAAAVAPAGDRFVVADGEGRVTVFDAAGAEVSRLPGRRADVAFVVWSPDGGRFALVHAASVTLHDRDGDLLARSARGGGAAFVPGKPWILVGDTLHDAALRPVGGALLAIRASGADDGVSPGGSRYLRHDSVWDLTALPARDLHAPGRRATVVASPRPGAFAVVDDAGVRIVDSAGETVGRVESPDAVRSVVFSDDGTRFATAHDSGAVVLRDAAGRSLATSRGAADVHEVKLPGDGARMFVVRMDGAIEAHRADGGSGGAWALGGAAVVRWWAAARGDGLVVLARDGLHVLDGGLRELSSFPLAVADGVRCAYPREGPGPYVTLGFGSVWRFGADGRPVRTYPHDQPVAAVLPVAGDRLVTVARDGSARLWDGDGRVLATLGAVDAATLCASPSGDRFAAVPAARPKTVRVWSAADPGAPATLQGHDAPVRTIRFSPDGSRLVTTGGDGWRTWEAGGRPLAAAPADLASEVDFEPDGDRLLAIVRQPRGSRVVVWDARGSVRASVSEVDRLQVTGAWWSGDPSRIVVATDDERVTVRRIDTARLRAERRPALPREFTTAERGRFGDLLGPGNASLHRVGLAVDAAFESLGLAADVVAALETDPALSESERRAAADAARHRGDDADRLLDAAWRTVCDATASVEEQRRALRCAAAAHAAAPTRTTAGVLAWAKYRTGDAGGALDLLAPVREADPPDDAPMALAEGALLAMANHSLGREAATSAAIDRLMAIGGPTDRLFPDEGTMVLVQELFVKLGSAIFARRNR